MSDNTEYVRIAQPIYDENSWPDVKLYNGEVGWAICSDGKRRFKIGDGQSTWSQLQYWDMDTTRRYCHNILLTDPISDGTTYNIRVNFFFINDKADSYSNGLSSSSSVEDWAEAFQVLVEATKVGIAVHGFYKVEGNITLPFRIKEKKSIDDENKTFMFQATKADHSGFTNIQCATNLTFYDDVYEI